GGAARRLPRKCFSLVEMMIAIVILGLGLIMVATMFPVAWDRARKLNEQSLTPNVTANAKINLSSILHCATLTRAALSPKILTRPVWVLSYGSFAGDLFYDPRLVTPNEVQTCREEYSILSYSDSRVHSLNVENFLTTPAATASPIIAEN